MEGVTGFKTATAKTLPQATAVMDPFHVVKLAADALTTCRQRIQQETLGQRGRAGDPLYRIRRVMLTGKTLLAPTRLAKLETVLNTDEHIQVGITWAVYQEIITYYRTGNKHHAKKRLARGITSLKTKVPKALIELRRLAATLNRRAKDTLAYFDTPGTSNEPPKPSTDA